MERRSIALPDGCTLDVDVTPEFMSQLRRHYGLSEGAPVSDTMVGNYVIKATVNACEKAEREGDHG